MTNICRLLKEFDLPYEWTRIESPTLYNGQVIPLKKKKVKPAEGYFENGNIINRNSDGSIQWLTMTIYDGRHVKNFNARFGSDGKYIDYDINYFSLGKEKNVSNPVHIKLAIDDAIDYARKNKSIFHIY